MKEYLVELTYFKRNGTYYVTSHYISKKEILSDIWDEVEELKEQKKLPGLHENHSDFHVLVFVPKHLNNHPHLIMYKD